MNACYQHCLIFLEISDIFNCNSRLDGDPSPCTVYRTNLAIQHKQLISQNEFGIIERNEFDYDELLKGSGMILSEAMVFSAFYCKPDKKTCDF